MAEKTILTRIVLTHDEFESLKGKTLKEGEVVLAKVGTTEAAGKVSEPIWMMKVGTGNTLFENCPWLVAPAADVHDWAKKASLDPNDLPEIPGAKLGISLTITGNGNAITEASWDADKKTLTLTKGETFATKKEFDEHSHNLTTTDDDIIVATGGDLSVDVKHKKELGDGKSYTTGTSTGVSEFGKKATINIPDIVVNEYGHITSAKDKEVEISIPGLDKVAESSHTHTNGIGTLVSGEGAKAIDLNVAFNPTLVEKDGKKYLQLLDATDSTKVIAEFDSTEFITDGMLESVVKSESDNTITFTWNTDAGISKTTIDIDDLVEVYTAGNGIDITNFVVSIKEKGVTKDMLAEDVQASLGKAETALQEHQDISGKADKVASATKGNFAGLDANGNLTDSGKKAADFAEAGHTHTTDEITDLEVGVTKVSTTENGGLKVTPVEGTGEVSIDMDDTIIFVLDGGDASRLD